MNIMHRLRKIVLGLAVTTSLFAPVGMSALVHAADVIKCPPGAAATESPLCQDDGKAQSTASNSLYGKDGIITKVIRLLSAVIGIVAVIVIIIGGFKYVLSSGDSNNINSAKNTILYAIVGLLVAVFAQAIIVFVLNKL